MEKAKRERIIWLALAAVMLITVLSACGTTPTSIQADSTGNSHDNNAKSSFNIRYELGEEFTDTFTDTPEEANAGDTVELKTEILYDADIHVYVDGQEIGKTHYDSDYWGYSFIMPDHDVLVTARFYTKGEIWGTATVDESVLREKYPEYFDLPTAKGLEVYVWQMAPNSYSCGVMEGTNRNKTLEEMMNLKGASIDEMKAILFSYNIPKEDIIIIPWQNPISSYLGEYWISLKDEDPDSVARRRQEYIDKLREMLLGNEETGFIGSELRVQVNGKTMTYERYAGGIGSLTPKTVLATFSEETEIEGVVWEVYSAEEYPDLTYVLVISGTNASWTYHIADNGALVNKVDDISLTGVYKVAYANWTENRRIISSCLNAEKSEKRNINTVWHLPVYKFDTKEDLDLFRDQFEDILTFEQGYDEVPSFNEVVSEYDDAFFAEHTVILAYVTVDSGSLRFGIRDVYREGNALCLNVVQTNHPEVGTSDMAGWFMIAEVLDKELESIADYDAKMVTETFELPEDFSFSIVWGCYGISSYDCKTGKLVKTKDATDVSKYTSTVQLTQDQMREVYRILLSDIDIFGYPDSYDPFNAPDAEIRVASEPNQTMLVLKTPKTRTSTRKVFLPKTVAEMLVKRKQQLEEYKDLLGSEFTDYNLVFCSEAGRPMEGNRINTAMAELIEKHGLPKVCFHSIRHTSTTYKLKLTGGDIKAVQGDTGHNTAQMVTERYAHILDDDRRVNAVRFEQAFYEKKEAESAAVIKSAATSTPPAGEASDKEELLELLSQSPEMMALLRSMIAKKQ